MRNRISENDALDIMDKTIHELVYPKYKLQRAYNYYNGVRDAEQFRYLEENFGIGQPTAVQFTPLIRKHVDAIVGEYLETAILPKVTCKDEETVTNITREKELQISQALFTYLQGHLQNSILRFIDGEDIIDKSVEKQMNKIIEEIDMDYVSNYEMAAQNVLEYVLQSRSTDFINKRRQLLLDLLITGFAFYKAKPTVEGNNIEIEILNPLNTFVDRNYESQYIKHSYRSVHRRWMNKFQILNKYGKKLSRTDIDKLDELCGSAYDTSSFYVRNYSNQPMTNGTGHGIDGTEVMLGPPGFPEESSYRHRLLPVYEVEWLEPDKDFVMQRYEGIRIGDNIYIYSGQAEDVIRTKDNPSYCGLSINGLCLNNRNNEPYSLVLACADLQDKYDLLFFYRDNVIANSGVSGDWLDISMLPTELGVKLPERIMKWQAYKKGGVALINTAQEGRAFNNNTSFAGFDDTVKASAIEGIELAIERTEQTCSSITGVFRERLNGISQHDAVSNVKVGVQNSYTVTKQFNQQMDLITIEILSDCLDVAKIVYREGLTGALIVGDKYQETFKAAPEYFTSTDFDIHITAGSDILRDMESIKAITSEFIQAGNIDPEIIVDAMTSKSLTDLKYKVKKGLRKKKEENDELGQLMQQNEQLQQQLKQLQQQLQQSEQKIASLNETQLQIEQQKLQMNNQLEWFKAHTEREFKQGKTDNDTKRTEVEIAQLYDDNPYNDEVVNI